MANSPTSIETQIDSFLEQFKRSASKAMEERMEWPDGPSPCAVVKSRSSCFALDTAAGQKCSLKKNVVPSIFPWSTPPITPQPTASSSLNLAVESHPEDDVYFDPEGAQKNYGKSEPPIACARVIPISEKSFEVEEQDPLQISFEKGENLLTSSPQLSLSHLDVHEHSLIQENQDDQSENINQKINQSMQTDPSPDCGLCAPFSIHKYKNCKTAINFFTGLETFEKLIFVLSTLGECSNLKYIYGPPPKKIDTLEQFYITLLILRRHKEFVDIAMLYLISIKQVSNIFITWVRFMSLQWKNLDLWIDRKRIQAYMPLDFYDQYPMTRVVIDATECPVRKPGLPFAQQATFSSYKNRNTVKFLIGIAPSGLITYVSPCYAGSATDRQIIERSSILHRFDNNDEIMVDKGLNVQDIFLAYGVKINMPSFFKKGNQIRPETLNKDRKVASKRVHVERVIGMLKTYRILTRPMNHTETLLSSDIVFICAMFVNFRSNIINKYA